MNPIRRLSMLSVCLLTATVVFGQWAENPKTGSSQARFADRTNVAGMSGMTPELSAGFVDVSRNAKEKQIVVQADVWGVNLISPQSGTEPRNDQACLSFVLDDNPAVKTDQKEYTFTDLSPGRHTITVRLLAADGQAIGSKVTLGVHIPK